MVKIGVVGVGHLGQYHTQKYQNIDNAELVGVYDTNFPRAQEIAGKLKVHCFSSYKEMLAVCDAVDIVATTTAHYELGKKSITFWKAYFCGKTDNQ